MDLKIDCKRMDIDGYDCGYKKISVSLEDINTNELDIIDVAKHIGIETFFNSQNERDIYEYVKHNYDWLDSDFKGFE